MQGLYFIFIGPGPERVPKAYSGCSSCSWCCYPFSKNAQGFVNKQRKVTKLRVHIRDIIPHRSTVLDFLLDGASFRVRSAFRTCFNTKDFSEINKIYNVKTTVANVVTFILSSLLIIEETDHQPIIIHC